MKIEISEQQQKALLQMIANANIKGEMAEFILELKKAILKKEEEKK